VDIVIYRLGLPGLLPTLLAKILGKKLLTVAAMSESRGAAIDYARRSLSSYAVKLSERINNALSNGIVVANERIVPEFGLDKYQHKILVGYPHYINGNLFRIDRSLKERGEVIGFIGRLWKSKGVLQLAKAIPLILAQKRDAQFIIVGDGPVAEELKEELRKEGCIEKVDFPGWVPYEQIPRYLNQMKFHLLPSYTETVGWVNLEAMACGAIAIASAVGGIPEIIRDGETGFLLTDNSPQAIAAKVLEVWDHPRLEQIQQRARSFIEENFTYEQAVKRWSELFSAFLL
jgi:glycosyltransferase involved in cell wall biosynthesis